MNIVIKKKDQKIDVLNNLKIVKNVLNNIINDLETMLAKIEFFGDISVLSSYFNSMHDTLYTLNESTSLIEYSINNNLDVHLCERDVKFIIGIDDYCKNLNEKTILAKQAINNYHDLASNPPKRKGFIKILLGLD